MISTTDTHYQITDTNFLRCLQVIDRSGAAELIDSYHQTRTGSGGRRPTGAVFTLRGVLVAALAVTRAGQAPSMAEILRAVSNFSPRQRKLVGMCPVTDITAGSDYKRFHAWLTRKLAVLDSGMDLPARRTTNAAHRAMLANRTEEQLAAAELARTRAHEFINLIVAASIDDPAPVGYRGDIVADESIIDLAGQSTGLGSKDDKRRSAAYSARYYQRDRTDHSLHHEPGYARRVSKAGSAIGVTAVTRVGPPEALNAIPPVFTGIAVDFPSSGTVPPLVKAIQAHQKNGFDQRKSDRARWPYLTTDMGYNVKHGFNSELLSLKYAPVVRYPSNWRRVYGSVSSTGAQSSGPVQISGEFYCPAAQQMAGTGKIVPRTTELLKKVDGFERHDRKMAQLLPLLMGVNSRPYVTNSSTGRPRKNQAPEKSVRIDLVCPAVQGRVRCPLKPASMHIDDGSGAPTVAPTWNADQYKCCQKSQVTHTYTADQWRMAQWGMVPGSWEHTTYYEAARALTEQRFSIMKSKHLAGFDDLTWAPRREQLLMLIVAVWVAATNLAIQDSFHSRKRRVDSMIRRLGQVAEDLGREPTRVPPRT